MASTNEGATGRYSWSQTIRGKEALFRDFYSHLASVLTDGNRRTIAQRFIADGDRVVVESVGQMQTKAGVPYSNEYCLIYRLRDGKIAEITECDSALCEKVLGRFHQSAGKRPVERGADRCCTRRARY